MTIKKKEEQPVVKTIEPRHPLIHLLLKYRLPSLIAMAGVGALISIYFYKMNFIGLLKDSWLFQNLTLLGLSLPVLILLWYYRTHDVQEQIDKAQSNINTSLLNKGIDLLLTEVGNANNGANKRSAGLIILTKLRQQDATLRPQIDALTRGADLSHADLRNVDLSNTDLFDADLHRADLRAKNLDGANLQGAKYNSKTMFPEGFDPERAGMKLIAPK